MRVKALLFAGLVSVLAVEGASYAEKVKANAEAKVYNRKGEQGKVLVRVKEGQAMTVLAKEGRWLKVRVSGRTGFIPRSYVDAPEADDEIQRNTRRRAFVDGRGTKRGFGGGEAPDDRVGADATGETDTSGSEDDDDGGDEKPTKPSKPEKTAKKPTKGEDDEGDDEGDDDKPSKPEKMTKKPAKPEKAEKPEKPEKSTKKPAKGDDDEGDDEDPIEKKGSKTKPKDESDDEGSGDEAEPKDAGDADEEEKDARKKARVSEKTVAFAEADKESDEAFTAKPDQTLYVEEEKGKWTEVSVDDGDIGWVLTSKLDVESGDEDEGGDDGAARGGRRIIDVRARLGFSFFNQRLSSSGGGITWPDKYSVGSTTAAVSLGGDLLYPYKKDYVVGGEMTYDYGKAVRGIAFDDPNSADGVAGSTSTTSFSMHSLNVRGMFGYDFHKSNGMIVFARLGYHFEQLLFKDAGNLATNMAKLPSETLKGPMIGAAFAIPAITPKIGARISLDAVLVGGSLSQTKGLEDGASPTAKKYVLGAGFTYRYKPGINIGIGYDLQRTSVSFGAPVPMSVRMHTGTGVSRTDTNHLFTFGLAKAF
ncbi:MAG TPA: SH3 domain-containing protein [Kofleriaceae bacterium]|jgi:uncharacterized protein YgiM (DUF1202 family)